MITKKAAVKELTKLSLCYPATRYNNDEIEVMAEMWVESFINISPDVFIDACKLHREQSYWFPILVEILDNCNTVWESRRRNIKRLPEPIPDLTPEQIKENADKVRVIIGKWREMR